MAIKCEKFLVGVLISLLFLWGCNEYSDNQKYPKNTGDIVHNLSVDGDFAACNESRIVQHYRPYLSSISGLYKGDKFALREYLENGYNNDYKEGQSGFITTRFVVNCNGQTGRYRTETMTVDYQPYTFDRRVEESIVSLIKEDTNWLPMSIDEKEYDYYVYVSVELEDGVIKKVLP